jgi:hypothetical protein
LGRSGSLSSLSAPLCNEEPEMSHCSGCLFLTLHKN